MRKIKKINGFLVVRFNDREKREYEGTSLGEYGVIDAELYTGNLDIDRGAMEYDDADSLDVAIELARGLESEEDITDEPPTYTVVVETDTAFTETEVEPQLNNDKDAHPLKADLGEDGKVLSEQMPEMNYAPSTHASQHASKGSDPIKPDEIGAADASHTHSASDVDSGVFELDRIPILPLSKGGTGKNSAPLGLYALINGSTELAASSMATGDILALCDVSAATGKKVTLANFINYLGGTMNSIGKMVVRTFTTSATWTAPTNILNNKVRVIAVGGGGGGASGGYMYGGGGGGSGYITISEVTVTAGTAYTVTIGAGGSGGAAKSIAAGSDGSATKFGSLVTADGGKGGGAGSSSEKYGGAGGAGNAGGGGGTGAGSTDWYGGAGGAGSTYGGGGGGGGSRGTSSSFVGTAGIGTMGNGGKSGYQGATTPGAATSKFTTTLHSVALTFPIMPPLFAAPGDKGTTGAYSSGGCGGGGGGGYGSKGGNGGSAGGGGGGFGGDGGDSNGSTTTYCGGGGGGGFFGKGGSCGNGLSIDGEKFSGAGGAGSINDGAGGVGGSGCCIIIYQQVVS